MFAQICPQNKQHRHIVLDRNYITYIIGILTALTLCAGCAEESMRPITGASRIIPKITVNPEVVIADDRINTVTLPEAPTADDFRLILKNGDTGESAEWTSAADFDTNMMYTSGNYTLYAVYGSPFSEGFVQPCFSGYATFIVAPEGTNTPEITCSLITSMITVEYDSSLAQHFSDVALLFHTPGGGYVQYPMDETRPMYIAPGDVEIYVRATRGDGATATVYAADLGEARANYLYHATVDLVNDESKIPSLRISTSERLSDDDIVVPLTDDLFSNRGPQITPLGFVNGQTFNLPEGSMPVQPVQMAVHATDLAKLILTTRSATVLENGLPSDIDLCRLTPAMTDSLNKYGLHTSAISTNGIVVDFTDLIPTLRYRGSDSEVTFILVAVNNAGQMSEPMQFSVQPEPVDLDVISHSDIVAGVNRAQIVVKAPSAGLQRNMSVEYLAEPSRQWQTASDITVTPHPDDNTYTVDFSVPEGNAPVTIRVLYMGKVRKEIALRRIAPAYDFSIDPFARTAAIRITPADPAFTALLTREIKAYVNGTLANITSRNDREGIITIGGLRPSTHNILRLTLAEHPADIDYSSPLNFTTEADRQLPNADFEEFKSTIDYKNMLSGGRYSQNFVEIFNQQNHTTFALSTPRSWANTNAKTFSTGATNHNTWYMQPSCHTVTDAQSGAYAVRLISVGWDSDGQPIPDYLQESQPFVPYSRNVPNISHNAAGKIFLGSYAFNPLTDEETYDEGMAFTSRPASLNGYYKFRPGDNMPGDRGLVKIEVLATVDGQKRVIASAMAELPAATTYTAFSIPLSYPHFGVKAESIRVMAASSVNIGDITFETNHIFPTINMAESNAIAGSLWIDNLTLAY